MKIFCASLLHETLSPNIKETTKADFAKYYLKYNGEHGNDKDYWLTPAYLWRELCQQQDFEFAESLSALAAPSGTVNKKAFEEFCQTILDDLSRHHQSNTPIKIILLNLHGAMVADGYDDCEGHLLTKIREIVGQKVAIGVLMDLHAHHTPAKQIKADAIIYYHEYPHTDLYDRAKELFETMTKTAQQNCLPKMVSAPTHSLNHMLTLRQPMRCIIDFMKQHINPDNGIELASIAHGFPWADVPHSGVIPVVVYNDSIKNADKKAKELADVLAVILYALRTETKPQTVSLDEALQKMAFNKQLNTKKPIVLGDYADNPGGGALGRSTFAIQELLALQIPHIALSSINDETVVDMVFAAGENKEIEIDLGGSLDPHQQIYDGNPLHLKVKVIKLINQFHDEFAGGSTHKGKTARLQILSYFDGQSWLAQNDCDVIINSLRDQTFSPKCFTAFNIDVTQKQLLIVKSMYHYQAGFLTITDPQNILTLEINGRLSPDLRKINYQKLSTKNLWPFVSQNSEMEQKLIKLLAERNSLLLQFLTQLENCVDIEIVHKYFTTNTDLTKVTL